MVKDNLDNTVSPVDFVISIDISFDVILRFEADHVLLTALSQGALEHEQESSWGNNANNTLSVFGQLLPAC